MKKTILTILFIVGFIFLILYSINKNCIITPTIKTTIATTATSKPTTKVIHVTPSTPTPSPTPKATTVPLSKDTTKDKFILEAGKSYEVIVNESCKYTIDDEYCMICWCKEYSNVYLIVTDSYHPNGQWYHYDFKNYLAARYTDNFYKGKSYTIKVVTGEVIVYCDKGKIVINEK